MTSEEKIRVEVQYIQQELLFAVGECNDILTSKRLIEREVVVRKRLNRIGTHLANAMNARIDASTANNNREV